MTRVKKGPCFGGFQKIIKRGTLFYNEEHGQKYRFPDGMAGGKVKKASNMVKILVSIGVNMKGGAI